MTWPGFTAGTGTTMETHEILNWKFNPVRDPICLEFDFTSSSHSFTSEAGGYTKDPLQGYFAHNGAIRIDRGINYYHSHDLFEGVSVDQELLRYMTGSTITPTVEARPIEQILVEYYIAGDAPINTLDISYELDLSSGYVTDVIAGSGSVAQPITRALTTIMLDAPAGITNPQGLDIALNTSSPTEIYLTRVGLCLDPGPPLPPPFVPPGSVEACDDLQENISEGSDGSPLALKEPENISISISWRCHPTTLYGL